MKTYSKRVWMNKEDSPSTGSVVVYHGPMRFDPKEEAEETAFIELGGCHNKARLHLTPSDTMDEFVEKIKLLHKVVGDFIKHFEEEKD